MFRNLIVAAVTLLLVSPTFSQEVCDLNDPNSPCAQKLRKVVTAPVKVVANVVDRIGAPLINVSNAPVEYVDTFSEITCNSSEGGAVLTYTEYVAVSEGKPLQRLANRPLVQLATSPVRFFATHKPVRTFLSRVFRVQGCN